MVSGLWRLRHSQWSQAAVCFSWRSEGAIRFDDPIVGIKWPLNVTEISEKDKNHQLISGNFVGILV